MTASGVPAVTTGGFTCMTCGAYVLYGTTHVCMAPSNVPLAPVVGGFVFRAAWTCPVCGNGCAPWLDVCPGPHAGKLGGSAP